MMYDITIHDRCGDMNNFYEKQKKNVSSKKKNHFAMGNINQNTYTETETFE